MSIQTEAAPAPKAEKPRGRCTGCPFDYQLGTARTGEYKGQLVIRKHLSRVGPGECEGSRKPPAIELGEATGDEQAFDTSQFVDPAPAAEQLPHDRGHEIITHIPNGHDFTDVSGTTWRHGGTFEECTTTECVQFRNRLNPPPVDTPVQHQCDNGLYADIRNCPRHGVPTTVEKLAQTAAAAFPDPGAVLVNGMPVPADTTINGAAFVTPSVAPRPTGVPSHDFADPTPAPAELPPVSGQPEPERDQWGRYKILGKSHTRATTFAKLGSSTYALGEWNERMLAIGLTKRPDLLARVHGLDVKRDAKTINKIVDEAQEFAGNKVAANIGTAYHTFTERLDAGVCTLDEIPEQWRGRCKQYMDAMAAHGLTTRREWIERTTAVTADQVSAPVPVAGTLDRILRMPNGDLVIGDLKTSSNIEYSWSEIAVQLALYAHGVNTFGLFDWNRKEWETHDVTAAPGIARLRVRTDYAIVMHLPANGDGCTLYRVDLVKGWKFAQVSGLVQSRQKAKDVAGVMVPLPQTVPADLTESWRTTALPDQETRTVPVQYRERPEMAHARSVVETCQDPDGLVTLHQQAVDSGLFDAGELFEIQQLCADRWAVLNIAY
jgi:hypothetical protein